jgi:hypothetical protein
MTDENERHAHRQRLEAQVQTAGAFWWQSVTRSVPCVLAGAIAAVAFSQAPGPGSGATIAIALLLFRSVELQRRGSEVRFVRTTLGLGLDIIELREQLGVPKPDANADDARLSGAIFLDRLEKNERPFHIVVDLLALEALVGFVRTLP